MFNNIINFGGGNCEPKKLNLGCGKDPIPGYINMDLCKGQGVDKVINLVTEDWGFDDNTIDEIRAYAFLEHIHDPDTIMKRAYKVLKKGGKMKILVPYYHTATAHGLGHVTFFKKNSFKRYSIEYSTDTSLDTFPYFKITKRELIPTRLGKLFPTIFNIRYYASLLIGEIIESVYVELEK